MKHRVLTAFITICSLLTVVATVIGYLYATYPAAFVFTFRPFTVLPVIALLTVVAIIVMMLKKADAYNGAFYWFLCTCFANIFLLLSVIFCTAATTPEGAALWQSFAPLTYLPLPVVLLYFILSIVDDSDLPSSARLFIIPLFTMLFLVYMAGFSGYIEYHEPHGSILEYWGYQSNGGDFQLAGFGYVIAIIMATMAVMVRAYRRAQNGIRKAQYRVIMYGIAFYTTAAIVLDIICYIIDPHMLPPMSFFYVTALNLFFAYAILRYGTFRISPVSLATPILANLSEAVIGANNDRNIEFVNMGTSRMLGYEQGVLLGQPIARLFDPATVTASQSIHSYQDGVAQFEDAIALDSVGREVPITMTISQVSDKQGRQAGYIYIAQNVTELRKRTVELAHEKASVERKVVERTQQLHEEQAKLRASIDSLSLGFLLVDESGDIIVSNDALTRMFGLEAGKPSLNRLADKLIGFDLVAINQQVITTAQAYNNKEVSADTKVLHIIITPVITRVDGDKKVIGTVALIEDVSEAIVLERSRDEFFSIASHELRTPLTSIRGNAKMIMDFYAEALKDEGLKEMVGDIHDSSVRLIGIVNDFLDLSRIEQGKITIESSEFAIEEVVESVAYEMKASLQEKKLYLKVDHTLDTLPRVFGDKNRVKQVVYNLIGNSVKFTDKGGITLKAVVAGNAVKVTVADTGRGITKASQKLLFHKFQQAGDSLLTRDTARGTGLGLYISRLLVQAMGGTVELEKSAEGKGSTFSFTLPIATPALVKKAQSMKAAIDITTGMTIKPADKA